MSTQELDRSVLDGKDREELHAIAGAMGVKAPTRMRKSELIDAILDAAEGGPSDASDGDGDGAPRRTIRSARASELAADSVAALVAEEEALPAVETVEPEALPARPPTSPAPSEADDRDGETEARDGAPENAPARDRPDFDDERASYGDGNTRRRRRRRGRGGPDGERETRSEPAGEPVECHGLLELRDEGYGFLRTTGYLAGPRDVYVSASQVRRFALRKGDFLDGFSRPQASNEKYPALLRVDSINGMTPDAARDRPRFEDLTALFPDEKLRLELGDNPLETTGRIIDLVSPVGKGQRGLIVSPPKAGKTTILKQLVYSIERNNPEVHLIVLLVDERPEEVTDMRRHVLRGDVVSSTFDRPAEEHTTVAELAIERAKRLVEQGTDVVVVLDGITRLARAHNLAAPASGRILSGGVDSTALYPPKRFFGAARNIEEGGSLTIIATALIDTGSRMDEVIFEEFKGTGNMELRLDRRLAERRIYPAIDVEQSSTRHEELLFERNQLNQVWKLRRVLNALDGDSSGGKGLELLLDKLRSTKSNDEFLAEVAKAPTLAG
ncbi:MAG TPA: transcription termination factor Rho [Acidimicrobiia bacterium]|nr:transcription termination factor Rho [Acidimicrobiia bacterium]